MNVVVVGHVEWAHFARVDRLPTSGEIVHASETFEVPAGGGAVAAVQLYKLAGNCTFYTALGDDELGHRAQRELAAMGVRVAAVWRDEPTREAFVHVERTGERTITVMGARLGPRGDDPLPWDDLAMADAVFFCAGDDDALRLARRAKRLVVTSRESERIARAGIKLDAVVGSALDPSEAFSGSDPAPTVVVETEGARGGRYRLSDGREMRFEPGVLRRPIVCAYGSGDSFVAALTYGIGAGMTGPQALRLAANAGAACLTGRGPYAGQLTADDL